MRVLPPAPPASAPVETPEPPPVVDGDPFSEPARPVAPPESGQSPDGTAAPESGQASAIGPDVARAYLPLLYGVMDALAGAGAIWIIRRKLGDDVTDELVKQAQELAKLQDSEKAALEGVLVQRLATIRLSPDEALMLSVMGIYAAKALAVNALTPPPPSSLPPPITVVARGA